jgi:predicted transcriptional regulator
MTVGLNQVFDEAKELKKAEILRLSAQGMSQGEIGQKLGVTQQQISKYYREAWDEIRVQRIEDYEHIKTVQLAKLGLIQQQAWEQWHRSKRPKKKKVETEQQGGKGGGFSRDTEETLGRLGDPRYLAVIQRAVEKECELLGLNDQKVTNVQVNVFDALAGQTEADPVEARMKELLENRKRLALAMAGKDESGAGEVIEVVPEVNHCPLPGSMWPTLG